MEYFQLIQKIKLLTFLKFNSYYQIITNYFVRRTEDKMLDCLIIGAGPAGITAAVYARRYNLNFSIVEENSLPGGKATLPHRVENYIGFPDGIAGYEISERLNTHLKNLNIELKIKSCKKIAFEEDLFRVFLSENEEILTKSLIIATGTKEKELGIPGEEKFKGRGVSYCATCDAPFFKGKNVAVIGGGDTALSEALYISEFAENVIVIHRREELRGAEILQNRIKRNEKIKLYFNSIPIEIYGSEYLEGLKIKNKLTEEKSLIPVSGVFIFAGYIPNTLILDGLVELNEDGYVITDENMATNKKGIFAAGDVRVKSLRQIVTAISDGAIAAHSVRNYIKEGRI